MKHFPLLLLFFTVFILETHARLTAVKGPVCYPGDSYKCCCNPVKTLTTRKTSTVYQTLDTKAILYTKTIVQIKPVTMLKTFTKTFPGVETITVYTGGRKQVRNLEEPQPLESRQNDISVQHLCAVKCPSDVKFTSSAAVTCCPTKPITKTIRRTTTITPSVTLGKSTITMFSQVPSTVLSKIYSSYKSKLSVYSSKSIPLTDTDLFVVDTRIPRTSSKTLTKSVFTKTETVTVTGSSPIPTTTSSSQDPTEEPTTSTWFTTSISGRGWVTEVCRKRDGCYILSSTEATVDVSTTQESTQETSTTVEVTTKESSTQDATTTQEVSTTLEESSTTLSSRKTTTTSKTTRTKKSKATTTKTTKTTKTTQTTTTSSTSTESTSTTTSTTTESTTESSTSSSSTTSIPTWPPGDPRWIFGEDYDPTTTTTASTTTSQTTETTTTSTSQTTTSSTRQTTTTTSSTTSKSTTTTTKSPICKIVERAMLDIDSTSTDKISPPEGNANSNNQGDGWDLGFTADKRMFNVYHHQNRFRVDGNYKTGGKVAGYPFNSQDYLTPFSSRAIMVDNMLYSWVYEKVSNRTGVIQFNTDNRTIVQFTPITRSNQAGLAMCPPPGGCSASPHSVLVERDGSKKTWAFNWCQRNLIVPGGDCNKLMCFDVDKSESCGLYDIPLPQNYNPDSVGDRTSDWIIELNGKLFIVVPNNNVDRVVASCFDLDTMQGCSGTWPAKIGVDAISGSTLSSWFIYRSNVCVGGATFSGSQSNATNPGNRKPFCFDPTGKALGYLPFTPRATYYHGVKPLTYDDNVYFPAGDGIDCFSFATNQSCKGFPLYNLTTDTKTYTVNQDPYNPGCLWVNGDSGQIRSFTSEGAKGCSKSSWGAVSFSDPPPQECKQNITRWNNLNVTSPSGWRMANVSLYDQDGNHLGVFSIQEGKPLSLTFIKPVPQTLSARVTFPTSYNCTKLNNCNLEVHTSHDNSPRTCCSTDMDECTFIPAPSLPQSLTIPAQEVKQPGKPFNSADGGDGWDLITDQEKIYNLYHHMSGASAYLDCHVKETGSRCQHWSKTYATLPSSIGDPNSPYIFWGPDKKIYTWVQNDTDKTRGVACMDPSKPPLNQPAFCGYFKTGPENEAVGAVNSGQGMPAGGAVLDDKIYAINQNPSKTYPSTGSFFKLHCFDMKTRLPCPGQPYAVDWPTNAKPAAWYSTWTVAAADKIFAYIPGGYFTCFDPVTLQTCIGDWPKILPVDPHQSTDRALIGSPFPMVDIKTGQEAGVCIGGVKTGGAGQIYCYSPGGNLEKTYSNNALEAMATGKAPMSGVLVGTRYYAPSGHNVACYDFANAAPCVGFNMNWNPSPNKDTYTVREDPYEPGCMYMVTHDGKIVNFDAFTGKQGCGTSSYSTQTFEMLNKTGCTAEANMMKWKLLTPTPEQRSYYGSMTVTLYGVNGNPLEGFENVVLPNDNTLDLTNVPNQLLGSNQVTAVVKLERLSPGCPNGCAVSSQLSWIEGATTCCDSF